MNADDIAILELTLRQSKLLLHAFGKLNSTGKDEKSEKRRANKTTLMTTKSLSQDASLNELLKKIRGVSLDDLLMTLGTTEQPFTAPLEMVDNKTQVFLGTQQQACAKKEKEAKFSLLPDFVNTGAYDRSSDKEQEIGEPIGARIEVCATRSKPQLCG